MGGHRAKRPGIRRRRSLSSRRGRRHSTQRLKALHSGAFLLPSQPDDPVWPDIHAKRSCSPVVWLCVMHDQCVMMCPHDVPPTPSPVRQLMVVDLPAPLGPSKQNNWFSSILNHEFLIAQKARSSWVLAQQQLSVGPQGLWGNTFFRPNTSTAAGAAGLPSPRPEAKQQSGWGQRVSTDVERGQEWATRGKHRGWVRTRRG